MFAPVPCLPPVCADPTATGHGRASELPTERLPLPVAARLTTVPPDRVACPQESVPRCRCYEAARAMFWVIGIDTAGLSAYLYLQNTTAGGSPNREV